MYSVVKFAKYGAGKFPAPHACSDLPVLRGDRPERDGKLRGIEETVEIPYLARLNSNAETWKARSKAAQPKALRN